MGSLSVQQSKQIDAYIASHKGVSRTKAAEILFGANGYNHSAQGLEVEHSNPTDSKKTRKTYNVYSPQIKQQGTNLSKDLYNQIEGTSINSKTIELLKKINPANVLYVLDGYSKQTKGKETLAQAINNEWGLDEITVKQYICKSLVDLAKDKGITGIYYGDYMKLNNIEDLNNWIEKAKTNIKISLNINPEETTVIKNGTLNIDGVRAEADPAQIYKNRRINSRGKQIGNALFKQIKGASNGKKTLKLIQQVNSDNILSVMGEYKKLSKESLPQALKEEFGLDFSTDYKREDYVKYLYQRLTEYADKNKINIPNNLKLNNNNLEQLVEQTDKLYAYINSKAIPEQTSLKEYINNLGYSGDATFAKNFEEKTGVSFDYAVLTDPTISKSDKINAIRNNFTIASRIAKYSNINIQDIIDDANSDLQALANDGDFNKYAPLFESTTKRIQNRMMVYKTPSPTNGKIDNDFQQGATGDCWLLAAIKGISLNPKGLKILNDSVNVQPNGNVKVHLKGVNKTYEISKEEISNANELSSGDGDVRALEIAVNRYLRETYKFKDGQKASINGNFEYVAFHILTGKGDHFFSVDSKLDRFLNPEFYSDTPIDDEQIEEFNDKDTISCVSAHGNKNEIIINDRSSNQSSYLVTGHAYTVARSDNKYVYLINPWDTSREIPVSRKTFKEFFDKIEKFEL